MDYTVCYHSGVLGMKWGVRRYQNPDGSYTAEGKRHRRESMTDSERSEKNKKIAKAVAVGVVGTATVAAAYYVRKHPETAAKLTKMAVQKVSSISSKTISNGKDITEAVVSGMAKGAKEGVNEGARKLGKALVVGTIMNSGKKALDQLVGKEQAAKIFQANNPKKIDKFWKITQDEDRDDDD